MTSKKVAKVEPKLVYRASAYVEPLYAFAKSVASMTDEVLVDLGVEGLYVRTTDPAHVAMVEATLGPSAFQALGKVEGKRGVGEALAKEGVISFVTDISRLVEALRWARRRKAPTVALELRELGGGGEGAYLLSVAYKGVSRAVTSLSTKDYETRSTMPTFKALPALVGDVQALALRSALEEASDVADACRLRALRGKGPSRRDRLVLDAPYAWSPGDGERVEFEDSRERILDDKVKDRDGRDPDVIDARYPLDYLLGIVKTCFASSLSLRWGSDYPIEIEWDIARHVELGRRRGDLYRDDVVGHVKFLLAPRVDHDFDEA